MLPGKELVTFIKLGPELKEGMLEWEAIRRKLGGLLREILRIEAGTSMGYGFLILLCLSHMRS